MRLHIKHKNPFHSIIENLTFAEKNVPIRDNKNQQRHNDITSNESVDDELDDVRKEKEENKNNLDNTDDSEDSSNNEENDASDDTANTDMTESPDSSDDPLADPSTPSPGGGDASSPGGGDGTGMDAEDDPNQQSVVGSANRRYTLFNEYNKIASILKESINSLSDIECYNSDIKDCVSQLQSATDDITYIISKFKDFSEPDLMIQFEMIKKRASIIVERLKRLKNVKNIKE
jgi:hypothetical protein